MTPAFSPDSARVITASADRTARICFSSSAPPTSALQPGACGEDCVCRRRAHGERIGEHAGDPRSVQARHRHEPWSSAMDLLSKEVRRDPAPTPSHRPPGSGRSDECDRVRDRDAREPDRQAHEVLQGRGSRRDHARSGPVLVSYSNDDSWSMSPDDRSQVRSTAQVTIALPSFFATRRNTGGAQCWSSPSRSHGGSKSSIASSR